jgi:hypothetical protein
MLVHVTVAYVAGVSSVYIARSLADGIARWRRERELDRQVRRWAELRRAAGAP